MKRARYPTVPEFDLAQLREARRLFRRALRALDAIEAAMANRVRDARGRFHNSPLCARYDCVANRHDPRCPLSPLLGRGRERAAVKTDDGNTDPLG